MSRLWTSVHVYMYMHNEPLVLFPWYYSQLVTFRLNIACNVGFKVMAGSIWQGFSLKCNACTVGRQAAAHSLFRQIYDTSKSLHDLMILQIYCVSHKCGLRMYPVNAVINMNIQKCSEVWLKKQHLLRKLAKYYLFSWKREKDGKDYQIERFNKWMKSWLTKCAQ